MGAGISNKYMTTPSTPNLSPPYPGLPPTLGSPAPGESQCRTRVVRIRWGGDASGGSLQLTLRTLPSKEVVEEPWSLLMRCGRMGSPLTRVVIQQWELCQHVNRERDTKPETSWYLARARNSQDPAALPFSSVHADCLHPASFAHYPWPSVLA